MALYMNRIIDFDLTKSEGKFTVKAGVDPDLDISKFKINKTGQLQNFKYIYIIQSPD